MKDDARQTRSRLMELFAQQGLHPRHDLGQNFLVDLNLHEFIVRNAQLNAADVALEVGAGTGGLTARLAAAAGRVVSVEYDDHVFRHAQAHLAQFDNVRLIHGDALENKHHLSAEVLAAVRTALAEVQAEEQDFWSDSAAETAADADNPWRGQARAAELKLVANLPYNVATPVISNLVATDLPWSRMVVTIQWELAERIAAQPGTSAYSALSVWLQSQARVKLLRKLPPTVFWPRPNVDSAIVLIERDRERQALLADRGAFQEFLRDAFAQRRKQLIGALAGLWRDRVSRAALAQIAQELGLPADVRAEQMSVSQLVEFSNRLATAAAVPASH